ALAFVITAVVALCWRERALRAERNAAANLESLRYWQERACEWSDQVREWEDFFDEIQAEVEADDEDAPPAVYLDQTPGAGPQNQAQLFNYANQIFLHRLLNWDPRHD
ncbi:MAG: hypothetical protein GWN58_25890, partial [Anaerolineae bacterium]|nr:hypothetical protein [Anaerolineae bacterium]